MTELIFEDTKTTISSNTLKRVWGRIKYESTPSDVTLNTLAKFLGYEDFRTFTKTAPAKTKTRIEKTTKRPAINWPSFRSRPSIIFVSGAVFMLAAIIALSYNSIGTRYDSDDFYFTSRKVTKGLPNSVVFEYRASTVPESAKLEIQQSWDKSKRMTVSREDSLATSIYFDPGYFNSKLVVDGQVVKEHSFLIPSDGWKAKVESGENTLYFKDSSITVSGKVAITNQLLTNAGIDYDKVPLQTNYRYVDDFEDLRVKLRLTKNFRN